MKKKKEVVKTVVKTVDKPTSPKYDFVDGRRGAMSVLYEQDAKKRAKVITLSDWPQSLVDAYRAGILTGQAAKEAEAIERYYRRPHPWKAHPSATHRYANAQVTNL